MSLRRELAKFSSLFCRPKPVDDLEEEIRAHVEMEEQENLESGMPPDEAHYAALRRFGNVTLAQERSREMWRWNWLEDLLQDVRYGTRMLIKNPGFAAVAVLTLALGIGANTAIFSVVNAVVLRPLPYPQSDRLVWISEVIPALNAELAAGGDYVDWRDQNKSFERMTAYDPAVSFNLTGRGTPARIHAAGVSANFFQTLGVDPQLGRSFSHEEDQPNGPKTVVLMQGYWQQYFGSDPQVLGKTVTLNSAPYTVVGVMPPEFAHPSSWTAVWTPVSYTHLTLPTICSV